MQQGLIEGYASLFDVADLSGDIVVPGAFERSLESRGTDGLRLLYQHDTAEPIGIFREAFEDEVGLFVRAELNLETQRGYEAMQNPGWADRSWPTSLIGPWIFYRLP